MPHTDGMQFSQHAADETKTLLVASPILIRQMRIENDDSAAVYLHLWDKASVGAASGAADRTILVPANDGILLFPPSGKLDYFSNGCVFALSSARASVSAPGAAGVVNFGYEV